jgi:hypothetical protein
MPFGEWSIDENLFNFIREYLPNGKTILELGSGEGTAELVKYYSVISIEHDEEWLNKYHNRYIHAPLKPHKEIGKHEGKIWYNARVLERELPNLEYDLLLVDGPPISRAGLVKYWDLFRHDVPVLFDDVNRFRDWRIICSIAARLDKPFTVYPSSDKEKQFGVIM